MAILFYRQREKYGCFSNFSKHPVAIEGSLWPTTEHYFQAMKFPHDPKRRQEILEAKTPAQAKRLAWQRDALIRADWDQARDDVMLTALRAKFSQHDKLRRILLSTGEETLIEHSKRDRYWGDGGDGSGKNMLGTLLMKVREELKSQGNKSLETGDS